MDSYQVRDAVQSVCDGEDTVSVCLTCACVCACVRVGGGPGEDEGTVAGHADAETGVFGPTAAEDRL